MLRYPEYKESGIEWIGEIPSHWDLKRMKYVCLHISEKRKPVDGDIQISPENVESHTGRVLNYFSNYETEGQNFCAGDILFNKLRVYLNKVVICQWSGLSMGEMIVLRPFGIKSTYFFRILGSQKFIDNADSLSEGVKMPRPPVEGITNTFLPIPSQDEQIRISSFLDTKTSQIESLIEKLERKIELLKEYRASLISQCVTKGLDADAEMKDSGIEWIGEIPSHWEVGRLTMSVEQCKNGIWGNEPDGKYDLSCVRVADFDRQKFCVNATIPTVRSIPLSKRESRVLMQGDLLLEKSGGGEQQPVGIVVIYDDVTPAVCSNFIARMTVASLFESTYLKYLHAYLYAIKVNTRSIKQTTGIQNLDSYSYLNERVPFPPQGEQIQASSFLDQKTSQIDSLIGKLQHKIELLKEYRQSLISNVVTGKIKVAENVE